MALSTLSLDEQGIILGQLRNALEPRLVMYFSSASKELRALLPPAVQQQLRADYEEATALCLKVGMRDCRELREATQIFWWDKGLTAADLATLAKLGSVLPALEVLGLFANPFRDEGLAALLAPPPPAGTPPRPAGGLKMLRWLDLDRTQVTDAGCATLAAALSSGALPALDSLELDGTRASASAVSRLQAVVATRSAEGTSH